MTKARRAMLNQLAPKMLALLLECETWVGRYGLPDNFPPRLASDIKTLLEGVRLGKES